MKTDIYLIRHGQPELQNTLLGYTDSPLNELGWQQLESTFANLNNFDYLVSSPLVRCSDFAKHYAEQNQIQSQLQIAENWQECHFGDWDGKSYEQLQQQYPQTINDFFNDPFNNTPPNGESLNEFNGRVIAALLKLLEQQEKRIVLLTHAGVIRTIVAWCLKMDFRLGTQFKHFAIDYASVTHISIYQKINEPPYPQLISLNKNA